MSTGSFGDPWDSGQVGFIYVTKEDIEKEYGAFNEKNLETAMSVLQGEVDIYDQYIQGDVYWYRLEKFLGGTVAGEEVSPQEALYEDIFWEEIDSCGGFYGGDVTENGMTAVSYTHLIIILKFRNECFPISWMSSKPDRLKSLESGKIITCLLYTSLCVNNKFVICYLLNMFWSLLCIHQRMHRLKGIVEV